MNILKRDGSSEPLDFSKIERLNEFATRGLNVDLALLKSQIKLLIYEGMTTRDIFKAQIGGAAGLISVKNPDFTFVAARYLLADTIKEAVGKAEYPHLKWTVAKGIAEGRYQKSLQTNFDLGQLDNAIDKDRDLQFDYYGLQNLVDRYLMRDAGQKLFELPQHFFMRVAMGLALNEQDPTARAIEFYELLSSFDFMSSTPTLFNSGTRHSQLSSCYLNTVADQISAEPDLGEHRFASIYGTIEECARLSKFAGGIGTDWNRVRGAGSRIESTNGKSSGVIPYLKPYNDTAVAVNQGGKRKGSFAPYLSPWHPDFMDYCELKKEFGDDRLRAHDIFPAAWIPDVFMERVQAARDIPGLMWSFFQPHLHPELNELHGGAFTTHYEALEDAGEFQSQRPVLEVWRHILTNLFETGHPWVTFKDECNRRSPQDHVGIVRSSNLCCVAADQRVVTDRGMVTVGELFATGGENLVVGLTGTSRASHMMLPRPNAPMVRIETAEGYSHKVTPDHRVWVKGKGWVEAQHVIPGEKLLIQQVEGLFGSERNRELALIAGMVAGDGTFGGTSVHIDLWGDKTRQFGPAIESAVQRVIASEPTATSSVSAPKFSTGASCESKSRLSSAPLARVLSRWGFDAETKLKVPEFVWKGDRDTVASYLRGLYLCDGNVQASGETTVMQFASVSREFLQDLQILWANFGVKSSLCKLHDGGPRDFGADCGGVYETKPCYRLLITSIQGCQIAERVTALGTLRKGETAEMFLDNLSKKGYSQKLHATFTGLTTLPNEDAYCLTVDSETHAWTVNGMVTHNTEITLNTSDTETAVCNLGSINLSKHVENGQIMEGKIASTVTTAMRMLDNVIDLNYYPSDRARNSNLKHRPVGLGIMGETEAKIACGISFDSQAGVEFSDRVMELVSFYAIKASSKLAQERGRYESYRGSKWSRGILPIDTARSKETYLGEDTWQMLRETVMTYGMRNSNCMAIAPTATISTLVYTTPCNEPIFEIERDESNMSGSFKVVDPCVFYGRPDLMVTAFNIPPYWYIETAARRQKWLDQAQSLNIFAPAGTTGRELANIYMLAWEKGLKTTYYLRSQSATKETAKVSSDVKAVLEKQTDLDKVVMSPGFCAIENPNCTSCE